MKKSSTYKKNPTFDDTERAERIRKVMDALCEANKHCPVIVEGRKDADALRRLGLTGEVIALHSGKGLYDFAEEIAEKFSTVILLPDWDAKGETIFNSLSSNLSGHWEKFSEFRELIKILCQKDIRDIEGIPGLLKRLEGS